MEEIFGIMVRPRAVVAVTDFTVTYWHTKMIVGFAIRLANGEKINGRWDLDSSEYDKKSLYLVSGELEEIPSGSYSTMIYFSLLDDRYLFMSRFKDDLTQAFSI